MRQGAKDFLSIVVPAVQVLLLGALTALVTANLDKFKVGMEENVMINQLVNNLSKDTTSNLKTDFAILSLERYLKRSHSGELKDYDRDMLVGFAKSVIINRSGSNDNRYDNKPNEILIPLGILEKYDSIHIKDVISNASNITTKTNVTDSVKVSNMIDQQPRSELINPNKKLLLSALIPKTVYIQFNNPDKRQLADSIRLVFQKLGWNAPSVEYAKGYYKSSIRYFHSDDAQLVDEACGILEPIYKSHFRKINAPKFDKVPLGQIEIWLNFNHKEAVGIPNKPIK